MKLADFVKKYQWRTVEANVEGEQVEFVVFDWTVIKERDEDGKTNVWEYFVGKDTEAKGKVEAGQWIPLAAGGMDQGTLRRDGGFKESGNEGMLFADVSKSADAPMVVYFDLAGGEPASIVASSLEDLLE